MARSTKEWIEYDHDKPIPERVKDRVALRADFRCQNCGNRVWIGGEVDHIPAVILLAQDEPQRESQLQFLCKTCHFAKTAEDVAKKSQSYQTRKKMGRIKRPQSKWSKYYKELKERGWNPWTRKLTP